MKKKTSIEIIAIALIVLLSAVAVVYATGAAPGSEGDPLVSKSYVDSLVDSVKTFFEGRISALENASGGEQTASGWSVIQVMAGSRVLGGEGSEIVLRSGTAYAIDNGADGISDLTAGSDLKSGTPIVKNHLLLVPREDGRGISCESDCWVMVKGSYTVD